MLTWCTEGTLMQTMCIQVVEIRAIEADEEQYRTEQELTSGHSELEILHSQDQAATSQSADTGNPHTRTNDLALAESALLSVKADLDTANQRIYQLQQSTNGQAPSNKQQPAISGQMYPDGLSRLSTGMKGRHSGLPSEAASDSSASSHEDTAQAMEVSSYTCLYQQCTCSLHTTARTACPWHGQQGSHSYITAQKACLNTHCCAVVLRQATGFWCEEEYPDLVCGTVQKVKGQVASLKASRDKLLAEVDRQSTEIERLLTHTATLEQVSFTWLLCLFLYEGGYSGVVWPHAYSSSQRLHILIFAVLCAAAFYSAGDHYGRAALYTLMTLSEILLVQSCIANLLQSKCQVILTLLV